MKKAKLLIKFLLGVLVILSQVFVVAAAEPSDEVEFIDGTVQSITLETNPNIGVLTVLVVLVDEQGASQTIRISQETAFDLGLISWNEDGNPFINEELLGQKIGIDPASEIPVSVPTPHPVGSAIATFFSDIEGVDYNAIMSAHEDGHGFGVIAQVLWLTKKLAGEQSDLELFMAILQAKQNGVFSDFVLEDGTSPSNWGQFKKAVLDGDKKINLGSVISGQNHDTDHGNEGGNGNGSNNGNGDNKNKEKEKDGKGKDKENKP